MSNVTVFSANGQYIIQVYETCEDATRFPDTIYPCGPGQLPGQYLFTNLPPGNYVVVASEQEVPTPEPGVDGFRQVNAMIFSTGEYMPVNLGPNENYADADFGLVQGSVIEGTVFHDVNNNGVLDGGDVPLQGITVTLRDADGNVVATAETNEDGEYGFVVTIPGDYSITYRR